MTVERRKILLVEDQADLAEVIKRHLVNTGYEVVLAADGPGAVREAERGGIDLMLLDLMLPGFDGLEVCRRLRSKASYLPIIMLTAKSSELDKVLGLEMGADDYLVKPFGIKELLARVKALLRRIELVGESDPHAAEIVEVGDFLQILPGSRTVRLRGKDIDLTSKEFDLLLYFAVSPERVFTRAQLLDAVWGYSHAGYDHAVNCHINRLRAKIELDKHHPEIICTVWGVGYKLSQPENGGQ